MSRPSNALNNAAYLDTAFWMVAADLEVGYSPAEHELVTARHYAAALHTIPYLATDDPEAFAACERVLAYQPESLTAPLVAAVG